MSWLFRLPVMALFALLVFAGGCDRKDEPAAVYPAAPPQKSLPEVIVPQEVQGQWKAVRIAVTDQESGSRETYTIDVGSAYVVENSQISIEVLNFLPAFIMEGSRMTSASNEIRNPATQIVIREKGDEVFRGWLFSLYPGVHSFRNFRYTFALVDFVPADKKRLTK